MKRLVSGLVSATVSCEIQRSKQEEIEKPYLWRCDFCDLTNLRAPKKSRTYRGLTYLIPQAQCLPREISTLFSITADMENICFKGHFLSTPAVSYLIAEDDEE